jgi:hypothetical protein
VQLIRRFINSCSKFVFKQRVNRINFYSSHALETQKMVFQELIQDARKTVWGRMHNFEKIKKYEDFRSAVPLQDYDSLKPFILRMMEGESNVLWHGKIRWFAKSSGTTSDRSKFIPVSKENLQQCHLKGGRDAVALFYKDSPNSKIMQHYSMIMGGSLEAFSKNPKTMVGDVSAIMVNHLPAIGQPFFVPDIPTALLADWDEKMDKFVEVAINNPNVVMIAGVPTWTIVLFRKILEATGKQHMLQVWPNFEVYFHGGVSFLPYKEQFQQFFPDGDIQYREVYNASEGYFAIQDVKNSDDMLLLLSNGVFYEFIPFSGGNERPDKTLTLSDVVIGVNYTLVISTNAGLWRYVIGDTIMFTSIHPYRIKVTGRTKQFINAFGEEVIVENSDRAIEMTCKQSGAIIREYTVAPLYFGTESKGRHQWFVEFEKLPDDIFQFTDLLDHHLRLINSDYDAKRFNELALKPLMIEVLPRGTFESWMKYRGKLGGQNKVPRLANHRAYVEDLAQFISRNMPQ